jgi:hypothetical protein
MNPDNAESPDADVFREARTSILVMAWLGLIGMILLGLGALTWAVMMLIYFPDHIGALTGDTIAFCLGVLAAATGAYGARTFRSLLRCGRHLGADGELGPALEQHRLFWRQGAILSGLLLLETLGFMVAGA